MCVVKRLNYIVFNRVVAVTFLVVTEEFRVCYGDPRHQDIGFDHANYSTAQS